MKTIHQAPLNLEMDSSEKSTGQIWLVLISTVMECYGVKICVRFDLNTAYILPHISLVSLFFWDIGNQYGPRSDAAERDV